MNPSTDSLFAGIAGIDPEVEEYDFGHGVILRKTYAHVMAPVLVAFSPAEKGRPHPAPWVAAQGGGLAIDIHAELLVPKSFNLDHFFDRLNTVWWLTALIRLKETPSAHTVVISDRHFSDVPKNCSIAKILPVEILPPLAEKSKPRTCPLSKKTLDWIKATWLDAGKLMYESSEFNDAFQAFDSSGNTSKTSIALLTMWGALEQLFSPSKQELRFRVSANIAAFLEPPGDQRYNLHKELIKLYDARSGVAHGTKSDTDEEWLKTRKIMERVLFKIFEQKSVPQKEALDRLLFGSSNP